MRDWKPSADLETIRQFASLLADIRLHFTETECLEVITPVLSSAAVSDPHIHSFTTPLATLDKPVYLHTSPEYAMKRLLAANIGDCYQICRVFRQGERGQNHNPEFTLLEWYREGLDHKALMQEVDALMRRLWSLLKPAGVELPPTEFCTYEQVVESATGVPLASLDSALIQRILHEQGKSVPDTMNLTEDALDSWLDLLMTSLVTTQFARDRFTLLYDYPASQAALARVINGENGQPAAARFELFFGPLELANGYHELRDAAEQRQRFEQDQKIRQRSGLPIQPIDEYLLAALDSGLPDCAGVAIGLERLMMILTQKKRIEEVLTFSVDHA